MLTPFLHTQKFLSLSSSDGSCKVSRKAYMSERDAAWHTPLRPPSYLLQYQINPKASETPLQSMGVLYFCFLFNLVNSSRESSVGELQLRLLLEKLPPSPGKGLRLQLLSDAEESDAGSDLEPCPVSAGLLGPPKGRNAQNQRNC